MPQPSAMRLRSSETRVASGHRRAYREPMTRETRPGFRHSWSAIGEGRYARQAGGAGQYGHVKIRISPSPPGAGVLISNVMRSDTIPAKFLPAVENGLREVARRGVDGGFLVEDIQIDLIDGSYHDTDSSDAAFWHAAAMAFRDAVNKAGAASDPSGDDDAAVAEPRHPRPAPRTSAVALPEPDDMVRTDATGGRFRTP